MMFRDVLISPLIQATNLISGKRLDSFSFNAFCKLIPSRSASATEGYFALQVLDVFCGVKGFGACVCAVKDCVTSPYTIFACN